MIDDPGSIVWCAAILAIGVAMYFVNAFAMKADPRSVDPEPSTPATSPDSLPHRPTQE